MKTINLKRVFYFSLFILILGLTYTNMEAGTKYTVIGTQIEERAGRSYMQGDKKITELTDKHYYLVLRRGETNYKLEVAFDYFNKNGNFGTVIDLPQKRKTDLIKL